MGIDLPKLLVVLPTGVIRREPSKAGLIVLPIDDNDCQVSLDDHDEYTFSNEVFCFSKPNYRVFYDGDEKILEYVYDGENLSIQMFTAKQSNLFTDATTHQCVIKALGPLCVHGAFEITSQFNIQAKALSLDGRIVCQDTVLLDSTEGLSLLGEMTTQKLGIRAAFCNQSAAMTVQQFFDLSAQVFCQTKDAICKTHSLRLISEISKLEGHFEVNNSGFLAISHLFLGQKDSESFIQFPNSHYIHLGALAIQGATQVVIGEKDKITQDSRWIIDEDAEIDELSSLECYNINMQCHTLTCSGSVQMYDSHIKTKTLVQKKDVTLRQSHLESTSIYMESGCFSVFSSHVKAKTMRAFSGELLVQDSSVLDLTDRLISDKAVKIKITASDVRAKQKIVLQGITKIKASKIQSSIFDGSHEISIKKSEILVESIQLRDAVTIVKIIAQAKDVLFSGQLHLDGLQIDATSVEYQSSNALITQNHVKAKQIILEGSTKSMQFVIKNSQLIAKRFVVGQRVCVDETSMVGIDDAKTTHQIYGHLFMQNSRFITDSRVRSLVGSHIHLCEFSEIVSGKITASGALSVDDSIVQCEGLNLKSATATFFLGDVYAQHTVSAVDSTLIMQAGSAVVADSLVVTNRSQVRLKKSKILLSGQILTDKGSVLDSGQSEVVARNIRFLGSTELTHTLLASEELSIYNSFAAKHSLVRAEKDISFADTAKAKLSNSALTAKNIDSFGKLEAEDTRLQASERASLWSDSETTLIGSSFVKAHDVVIRGKLITKKKDIKTSIKPSIIAEDHIDISPKAKISGDEDLIMSADIINQSGEIDLQAGFSAKGRRFDSIGSFHAESIYLGFDDAVVNHGTISAKRLTIHSNLMNIFGRIYAEEAMSSSGFVSLNMGVIAANNYMNDSLVSMNLGLIAPNLCADPRFIFSWNNLISTARTLALMWAPVHTSGIQLAFMIPGFINGMAGLYQRTNGFTRIFDLRRHEYMPILCQMKSLIMLGQNMYAGGGTLYNEEGVNWQTSFHKAWNNPNEYGQDWWNTVQGTHWQEVGLNTAEAFAGSYTDTSLLHANFGISLGANTLKSNWMHINMGEEYSLFSHRIATHSLYNRGRSTGQDSSFVATEIQNQGKLSGSRRFQLQAKRVDNDSGDIYGKHAAVAIDNLAQRGSFTIDEGMLQIGAFEDDGTANTSLHRTFLDGNSLESTGKLSLTESLVRVKGHIILSQNNQSAFDNTQLEAERLEIAGHLEYAHQLHIKAKQATLAKGSVVNGQKTDDDQLFTKPTGDDPDAKPVLKPQHVLIIEVPKVTLSGQLTGGDYTQIEGEQIPTDDKPGTIKCDELIIEESADVDLKHGLIAAKASKIDGKMALEDFSVAIDYTEIGKQQGLSLKHSGMQGTALHASGLLSLTDSQAQIDAMYLTDDAHPELIDSTLITHSLEDASQLRYAGQSGVLADKYKHTGYVTRLPQDLDKKSTLYVQAKSAELEGGGDLDNVIFQIDHFSDAAQFVAGVGRYANYRVNQSFSFITEDELSLSSPIARDCDIGVKAASIVSAFDYDKSYQLFFTSTQGDITFNNSLKASNMYAVSAGHIFNNGSAIASDNVFYDAQGNIENRGVIGAGKYTQLLAKGNVVNLCEEQIYGERRNYRAALIAGGTGSDTDGIGLYIKADGEVVSDASDFLSQGSNYIEGAKGVHFGARHHTYISVDETHKVHQSNWFKRRKDDLGAKEYIHTFGTSTDIGISHVHSANGRNIIRSGEGEVTSVATQFISPGGTDIYARGDVKLFSLKTNDHVQEFKTDWWGLKKTERDYVYQSSLPTLFLDNGTTRIHSLEGDVDARGAYFIGGGDLEIKAKKRVLLGVDILDHEMTEKMQAFGWSVPGMGAWDTYKQGGSIWSIGAALDPSISKANALYQSQAGAERLASAANLGVDLANTGNSLMRGIAGDNITDELLARYGLGHDGHLAPSVTLSLSQKKTKTRYQTQAQGGIDRGGDLTIESGEGLYLENGVGVYGNNVDINGPLTVARGGVFQSSVQQTTQTENLGIAGLEGVQSFGVSLSNTQTSSTTYINSVLSARGNMHLHHNGQAMQTVELDGANIYAQTLDANIGKLIIRSKQDTSQTQTKSLSLASSGQFGFYQGSGRNITTQHQSGIHVVAGINTDGHEVVVHETHMIGGKITTDGENHFKTDTLIAETLTDTQQYKGFGVSGNVHDFERLLSGKSSNRAGEQTFPTVAVQMDRRDFSVTQVPVIHGKMGTELEIRELEGVLETQHENGAVVQKDESLHLQVDVPVTNRAFLTQASSNVHAAADKLSELLLPNLQEPMAFGRPEPIVPVEGKKGEDSLLMHRRRRKHGEEQADMDGHGKPLDTPVALSPDETKAINHALVKAKNEYKTTGKLSEKTKHALTDQVVAALTKTAKAGTSSAMEKMLEALGPEYSKMTVTLLLDSNTRGQGMAKLFIGKTGFMLKLALNSELAFLDEEISRKDVLKHVVAVTGVEAGIDFVLKFALKEAAGPIGLGLTLLDISDSFYEQDNIDLIRHQGVENLDKAQELYRDGRFFSGWALERAAADQMGSTARAQAGHMIAEVPKLLAEGVERVFK